MPYAFAARAVGVFCALLLYGTAAPPASGQAVHLAEPALRARAAATAARAAASPPATQRPAAPHYDVVALRVAFQPDTSRFTTGDGTFEGDLFDGLTPVVDPLPHDADYFQAHLAFLEDYVARVSDGATQVTTHLIPEVVRVSQPMTAYSPTGFEAGGDAEMRKLAALVAEAWTRASTQTSFDLGGFDPERTAFVLFHAGVGRDVELIGTTLDKTPQDLPSIYFGGATLRRLLGTTPTFKGVPVENTLLLPRTETRRAMDFIQDEPFLLELSINGMLAASFFNYLGVPDLFNTETGESAIGPFGLMDPLGIFAYRGLFPPEPSAWTRAYLGWSTPVTLQGAGPVTTPLRAASLPDANDVARVPVSDGEYFLVENRYRDPEGDGLVLRVWKDGRIQEQRVDHADETFNVNTIEGFIGGVVVGVDNYDWALPGGVDENGHKLNGGILVWHVDERRLLNGFAANAVNSDPARRAVDVEEADGAQDLGFPANNPFGPANDQGSPFDFFYEGNPVTVVTQTGGTVRLYENRFGPDTHPGSDTNEGGPSFVVLDGFSAPAATMHFTYATTAEAGLAPVAAYAGRTFAADFGVGSHVAATADGRLLLVTAQAEDSAAVFIVDAETGATLAHRRGTTLAEAIEPAPGSLYVVTARDGAVTLERWQDGRLEPLAQEPGTDFHGPVVAAGSALYLRRGGTVVGFELPSGTFFERTAAQPVLGLAARGSDLLQVTPAAVFVGAEARWALDLPVSAAVGQPVFGEDAGGVVGVVPLAGGRTFLWLLPEGAVRAVTIPPDVAEGTLGRFPTLADLDGDGRLDVLLTGGAALLAYTQGGALVDGLPRSLPAPSAAQPLVAELTESGGWSVLVAAADGYLYAYDLGRRATPVPGFPLAVGRHAAGTPLLQSQITAADGSLQAWTADGLGRVAWGRLYGDARHASFVALAGGDPPPAATAGLLDAAETYNWPNPIREGVTYLRYRTAQDAQVKITILDGAGRLVDEILVDEARAGVVGEVRWQTDAPSGLYFARITATATDGTTQSRLVKMAVIR